jgi:coproporphyrinogen III oxidase-like Fe-S oxidoreductase
MSEIKFINKITDIWDYPKISTFNNKVNDNYFDFLNETTKSKEMRLYIHTPFCKSFCYFCQFFKEACPTDPEKIEIYTKMVLKELSFYAEKEYFKNVKISSIYFGGGDPAVLPVKYIEDIVEFVHKKFNVAEDVETTVEGNILNLLDENRIDIYNKINVSRVSFGVQTFKESLRKKLLLKPSLNDIDNLIELLNRKKIKAYTIDMMFNLPDQSYDDLYFDLNKVISYNSDYVDTYGLNLYPNTKFFDAIYKNKKFDIVPSKERELEMNTIINNFFKEREYNQVLSVTYSKYRTEPNKALNHYLHGGEMLGIGPSARSYIFDKNYRNVCSVDQYINKIQNGLPAIEAGNALSDRDIKIRKLVFFPTTLKAKAEDIVFYNDSKEKLDSLVESGFLEYCGEYVNVTTKGKDWVGNIQKYLYDDNHIKNEFSSFITSVKQGRSGYNQDNMGVNKKG